MTAFPAGNIGSDGPNISRLGNYSQIFTKSIIVSGSIEAVNKAGRKSEFKYQSEKRGKELMRDIEFALIASRDVKTAGSGLPAAGARKFGGYHSWVPTVNAVDAGASITQSPLKAQVGATGGTHVTIPGGDGSTIYQVANVADSVTDDKFWCSGILHLLQVHSHYQWLMM